MTIRVNILNQDIKKSGHNKFSHFYYFELKDFLSITTKMFKEHNLYGKFSIIPSTTESEEMATFTIINIDDTKEVDVYTIPTAECFIGRKADGTGGADPIQNLGGKITYLRRYMYFLVLDLIEDDAVDSKEQVTQKKTYNKPQNTSVKPTPPSSKSTIDDITLEPERMGSMKQWGYLIQGVNKGLYTIEQVNSATNYKEIQDMVGLNFK